MKFLTVLCYMALCITIHETGHVVVSTALGYRVKGVSLGIPLKPFTTIPIKIGEQDIHLIVSPYLIAGSTNLDMKRKPEKVLHWVAILLAGAFANTLVLVALYLTQGPSKFVSVWKAFVHRNLPLTLWGWFIIMNIAYGIGELIPFMGGDGTELLRVLLGR